MFIKLLTTFLISFYTLALYAAANVDGDRPTEGRSLFDHLVSRRLDNGQFVYEVPDSIPKLVELIKKRGCQDHSDINGVFTPFGRSLQKLAGDPDFFRYPRLIMGVTFEAKSASDKPCDLFLNDRLFVGYVEKSHQIEVISFNETLGRFEFQIVRDFGIPDRKPVVEYAQRSQCTSCHQHGGPIFSVLPWKEFAADGGEEFGNLLLGQQIINAQPHQESKLYGFDVAPHAGGRSQLQAIDTSIRASEDMMNVDILWRDLCGSSGDQAAKCRALWLSQLLITRLNQNAQQQIAFDVNPLMRIWNTFLRRAYPEGALSILPAQINDREPMIDTDLIRDPVRLVQILRSEITNLKPEYDPLTARTGKLVLFPMTNGTFALVGSNANFLLPVIRQNLEKLASGSDSENALVRKLFANMITDDQLALINSHHVNAPELMNLIQTNLGLKTQYKPELPLLTGLPLVVHDESPASGQIADPNISRIQSFCAPCHAQKSNPSVPGFLAANNEPAIKKLLIEWRDAMIERIESTDMPMPPQQSSQGKAMGHEDRVAIKEYLLGL